MESDLGIVVPAFNPDPERLSTYLIELDCEFEQVHLHVELDEPSVAVLDALEDTEATVRTANHRRGKGAAITAGFDFLDTEILAFVDADGSTPPSSIRQVIEPIVSGAADLSVGSRRHPASNVSTHQTHIRRRLGDGFARVARLILPVQLYDYQCGAKAITASLWGRIRGQLTSPGFAWDIEFVTFGAVVGNRLIEVPITWSDRPGSTVPILGTTSEFAVGLIRARHRAGCLQGKWIHLRLESILGSSGSVNSEHQYRSSDLKDP